jgi:hypothetical protein
LYCSAMARCVCSCRQWVRVVGSGTLRDAGSA